MAGGASLLMRGLKNGCLGNQLAVPGDEDDDRRIAAFAFGFATDFVKLPVRGDDLLGVNEAMATYLPS